MAYIAQHRLELQGNRHAAIWSDSKHSKQTVCRDAHFLRIVCIVRRRLPHAKSLLRCNSFSTKPAPQLI